jgi:hypothetical protein
MIGASAKLMLQFRSSSDCVCADPKAGAIEA